MELVPLEPMFENNGIWYTLGNRSLNNLNIAGCLLTEQSLKLLYDTVNEQELSAIDFVAPPDVVIGLGLFRISSKVVQR